MAFQDVVTMVLLHFPHSLTPIAHQKRNIFSSSAACHSSRLSISLSKVTLHPSPYTSLRYDRHMPWHHLIVTRSRLEFGLENKCKVTGETLIRLNTVMICPRLSRDSLPLQRVIHETAACDWCGGAAVNIHALWGTDSNLRHKLSGIFIFKSKIRSDKIKTAEHLGKIFSKANNHIHITVLSFLIMSPI